MTDLQKNNKLKINKIINCYINTDICRDMCKRETIFLSRSHKEECIEQHVTCFPHFIREMQYWCDERRTSVLLTTANSGRLSPVFHQRMQKQRDTE